MRRITIIGVVYILPPRRRNDQQCVVLLVDDHALQHQPPSACAGGRRGEDIRNEFLLLTEEILFYFTVQTVVYGDICFVKFWKRATGGYRNARILVSRHHINMLSVSRNDDNHRLRAAGFQILCPRWIWMILMCILDVTNEILQRCRKMV